MTTTFDRPRRMFAECLGTAALVAGVVGSGIMADQLTSDAALALLCNAVATGAILYVLISMLGPISGAHLNPAISVVFAFRRELSLQDLASYVAAQFIGAVIGVMIAHGMFGLDLVDASTTVRTGVAQWLSEVVASFGLVAVILTGTRFDPRFIPVSVGLYITAAYWFTASTSFANPAVATARALTDTFSGIRPIDVPAFVVCELAGALISIVVMGWLLRQPAGGEAQP